MGHFAKCCQKYKKINQLTARKDELFETDFSDGSGLFDNSNLFVGTISQKDLITLDDGWNIALPTNGTIVEYKIDSGSQANILPFNAFNNLNNRPKLNNTNTNLIAYNGTNIHVKGSCVVNIEHKNKSIPVSFIVADINSPPLLGLKTSTYLHIIKRVHEVSAVKNSNDSSIPSY